MPHFAARANVPHSLSSARRAEVETGRGAVHAGAMISRFLFSAATLALAAVPLTALAQPAGNSLPAAVAIPESIPASVDTPWPGGTITLAVDGSDTERGVWRVTETVPLAGAGDEVILLLPKWLPGHHEPGEVLPQIADLHFAVAGQPAVWVRDRVDPFAFHVRLPAGATAVVASFVTTSPLQNSEGQILKTREMMNAEWTALSLYPAGHYVRRIGVRPALKLPAGWGFASALDGAVREGDTVTWAATDYETLIDSPVFAGVNFKRVDMGHGIALNAFADHPAELAFAAEAGPALKALADEAVIAFGSRHFDHYDFLVGLTERLGSVGLEHHRSSENTMHARALSDWAGLEFNRNVLAHELVHSWNGKFRRPADLWTPDYHTPMQDDLLWVYEGQTQFWGNVLAVRSGVQSKDTVLGRIARDAGDYVDQAGRGWRSVADTTDDPIIDARRPKVYPSLGRGAEYYSEAALVWLEADQIIRAGTHGRKGLDDFARAFFGVRDGDWGELTYGRGDVVAGLNAVYAYDWAGFLDRRIDGVGLPPPLGGIELGGYRLVWKDAPNPYDKALMTQDRTLDLGHSLGLVIDAGGRVASCRWGSPAFEAGIVTGAKIISAGGVTYSEDALRAAITAAKAGAGATPPPVTLVVQRGERVDTIAIPYHDGLRWPWLDKAGSGAAGIDALLAPRREMRQ